MLFGNRHPTNANRLSIGPENITHRSQVDPGSIKHRQRSNKIEACARRTTIFSYCARRRSSCARRRSSSCTWRRLCRKKIFLFKKRILFVCRERIFFLCNVPIRTYLYVTYAYCVLRIDATKVGGPRGKSIQKL